jgi:hypothetical protein
MADAQASLVSAPAAISAGEVESGRTRPVKHHAEKKSPVVTFMPFVLTAVTFLATFVFQICQNRQQNNFQESQRRAQEDATKQQSAFQLSQQQVQQDATANSEWRKALEDLTAKDGPSASVGAYEMVSFLGAVKYGDQALAIVPSLLTKIDNPLTFDVILFDINPHINQDNQSQLITIDTILARDLSDLYRKVTHSKASARDRSFGAFLQAPDQFIDGSEQADLLNQAWTQTWELDSVSSALSNDWSGVNWGALHPTPQDQDLSGGVVFLNNDWSGIDFSGAELDGIAFFGKCKMDQKTKLPRSATVNCAHT